MWLYVVLFVVSRLFVQTVTETYMSETDLCRSLQTKASEASIGSVRNAYLLEVVQEDQRITKKTLDRFKIGFLASNATYAVDNDVFTYACKPPAYIETILDWTAGVTPLLMVWGAFTAFQVVCVKCKRTPPPPTVPMEEVPMEDLSKPPRIPSQKPPCASQPPTIRRRKKEEKNLVSNLETIMNMSPRLRERIMGEDV